MELRSCHRLSDAKYRKNIILDDVNAEALQRLVRDSYREKNSLWPSRGTFSGFYTDADRRDFTIDFISNNIYIYTHRCHNCIVITSAAFFVV